MPIKQLLWKKISFALFVIVVITTACSLPNNPACIENWNPFRTFPPPFGREHNTVREEIGLPIIPADWEASRYSGEEYFGWSNPHSKDYYDQKISFHRSKSLQCQDGVLISESDTYLGDKDFRCDDTPCRERIIIVYYYPTETTEAHWEVRQLLEKTIADLDKNSAIQIIQEWGLEYP